MHSDRESFKRKHIKKTAAFAEDPSLDEPVVGVTESQSLPGDSNILAPSSLTPSSSGQGKGSSSATPTKKLPSRKMMASAFGGKRSKKRLASPTRPSTEDHHEEGRDSKRRREEDGSCVISSSAEPGSGGMDGRRKSSKSVGAIEGSQCVPLSGDKDVINVCDEIPKLEPDEPSKKRSRANKSSSNCSLYEEMPKLDLAQPDKQYFQTNFPKDKTDAVPSPHEVKSELDSGVEDNVEESEVRSKECVTEQSYGGSPEDSRMVADQRTPARTQEMPSSPFLSSRRTRVKKSLLQESFSAPSEEGSHMPGSLAGSSQVSSVRGVIPGGVAAESFTSLSFNHGKEVLTAFSSRGHRSKATPSRLADSMWMEEEEEDEENGKGPLRGSIGDNEEGIFPSRCFEPVCDLDGFIRAREA